MDYPSNPTVGLVNGKFSDGDPANGVAASRDPAANMNAIMDELINVIAQAGLTPDEANLTQVSKALALIVPVGAVIPFGGIVTPQGYFMANGATPSRITYSDLYNQLTIQQTGNFTINSSIVTNLATTTNIQPAMPSSGNNIPFGATVLTVDSTTQITLSANATGTLNASPFVIAPWGVGDGVSTFTLPDLRGEFLRGWDAGRGVDTGRAMGSWQPEEVGNVDMTGQIWTGYAVGSSNKAHPIWSNGDIGTWQFPGLDTIPNNNDQSVENRPRNYAVQYLIKF